MPTSLTVYQNWTEFFQIRPILYESALPSSADNVHHFVWFPKTCCPADQLNRYVLIWQHLSKFQAMLSGNSALSEQLSENIWNLWIWLLRYDPSKTDWMSLEWLKNRSDPSFVKNLSSSIPIIIAINPTLFPLAVSPFNLGQLFLALSNLKAQLNCLSQTVLESS